MRPEILKGLALTESLDGIRTGRAEPLRELAIDLATKYGERALMYTEYPHKKFWSGDFIS